MLQYQIFHHVVSIHAPYAGSDGKPAGAGTVAAVSIHAPYAGSDAGQAIPSRLDTCVSIHAPYAGSDRCTRSGRLRCCLFQSTPPMQGATHGRHLEEIYKGVSIHAPYAWGDFVPLSETEQEAMFQSTPPMQGATHRRDDCIQSTEKFQSTPPMQGATQQAQAGSCSCEGFNPRPLCRERLYRLYGSGRCNEVSIHAPYAGSDSIGELVALNIDRFQSTPPMQGATTIMLTNEIRKIVSIHAPYAGSGFASSICFPNPPKFQSTPPMQGATFSGVI